MDNPGSYSGPYQGGPPNNKKLQQTQAQVDEVVGIMKINIEKVLERDQKLNELAEHADELLQKLVGLYDISHNKQIYYFIDLVVGIMRTNVAKVLERDEKLSELDQRADTLQIGASQFEQHAARLKRKFWWQNLKMMIIIGVICTSLLIIFLIWIFSSNDSSSGNKVADNTGVTPQP